MEAALWFHRLLLPPVRREFPRAQFIIAGFGPPELLTRLAEEDPGTRVTRFVGDTDRLYKSAAVFVVPILTGAGVIVKVLDALAAAPVVTTSFGNEGIAARHGEQLLVAAPPAEFAEAVAALFRDGADAWRKSAGPSSPGVSAWRRCLSGWNRRTWRSRGAGNWPAGKVRPRL